MYPIGLHIEGKLCIVIGGGKVAERKVQGLLRAGALVRVISPRLTAPLEKLAAQHRIVWLVKYYESRQDIAEGVLVFAATDTPEVHAQIVEDCRTLHILVNVADAPQLCDFQVPATLRRGDLSISVATNGKSPALAAQVRRQLGQYFGEEYTALTCLMADVRDYILSHEPDEANKKLLFRRVLEPDLATWIRQGDWQRIEQHLQAVLGAEFPCKSRWP